MSLKRTRNLFGCAPRERGIRRYVHLSTGNYNSVTANVYRSGALPAT
jgi:polyphosphate kinase